MGASLHPGALDGWAMRRAETATESRSTTRTTRTRRPTLPTARTTRAGPAGVPTCPAHQCSCVRDRYPHGPRPGHRGLAAKPESPLPKARRPGCWVTRQPDIPVSSEELGRRSKVGGRRPLLNHEALPELSTVNPWGAAERRRPEGPTRRGREVCGSTVDRLGPESVAAVATVNASGDRLRLHAAGGFQLALGGPARHGRSSRLARDISFNLRTEDEADLRSGAGPFGPELSHPRPPGRGQCETGGAELTSGLSEREGRPLRPGLPRVRAWSAWGRSPHPSETQWGDKPRLA